MSIFEVIMLVCFGAAWPVSIYKSYRSRSVAGKSILFLLIVELGYISGVIHKILSGVDYVICLYILNLAMVTIDIMLYIKNAKSSRVLGDASTKLNG